MFLDSRYDNNLKSPLSLLSTYRCHQNFLSLCVCAVETASEMDSGYMHNIMQQIYCKYVWLWDKNWIQTTVMMVYVLHELRTLNWFFFIRLSWSEYRLSSCSSMGQNVKSLQTLSGSLLCYHCRPGLIHVRLLWNTQR